MKVAEWIFICTMIAIGGGGLIYINIERNHANEELWVLYSATNTMNDEVKP